MEPVEASARGDSHRGADVGGGVPRRHRGTSGSAPWTTTALAMRLVRCCRRTASERTSVSSRWRGSTAVTPPGLSAHLGGASSSWGARTASAVNQRLPGTGCAAGCGAAAGATDSVIWTHHVTPARPEVVPFPATWPAGTSEHSTADAVLATTLVGHAASGDDRVSGSSSEKYFRLSALDDYQAPATRRVSSGVRVAAPRCISAKLQWTSRYGPPIGFGAASHRWLG